MYNIIKRILLPFVLILTVGIFTSCHHKEKNKNTETKVSQQKPVEPIAPPAPHVELKVCDDAFVQHYLLVVKNIERFEMSRHVGTETNANDPLRLEDIKNCLENAQIACQEFQQKYKGNEKCRIESPIGAVSHTELSAEDLNANCQQTDKDFKEFIPKINEVLKKLFGISDDDDEE